MSSETPMTQAEALLQEYLVRPLSHTERQQLLADIEQNPSLADDAALLGLLRELRLEHRIAAHEDAAWQAFSQLAAKHKRPSKATPTHAPFWQHWMTTLWGQLQPAVPALAAAVIVIQAGGLVWLGTSHPNDSGMDADRTRGGSMQTCPAVQARFKPSTTMTEVSQLLTQTQASIVSGPDAAGFYRLTGPGSFANDAPTLLQGIASDVTAAPDCKAPQ